MISIGWPQLLIAFTLIIISVAASIYLQIGLHKRLLIAAIRTTAQLLLVGLVLDYIFQTSGMFWVAGIAVFMLLVAAWEILARQHYRLSGTWGYFINLFAVLSSSFSITLLTLFTIIQADPWFSPQYAIPLLGMLLGNSMNGISLAMDRLSTSLYQQKGSIEAQLCQGLTAKEASRHVRRDAIRVGMIPIINAMTAAGIVSLPGMMTGQILAGTAPLEAVMYQILIMFLIAGATTISTIVAVQLASRRLFDERDRLRLDRLVIKNE